MSHTPLTILTTLVVLLTAACNRTAPRVPRPPRPDTSKASPRLPSGAHAQYNTPYLADTLSSESIRYNGQPIFQSLSAFRAANRVDSQAAQTWDCGVPYEWMEGNGVDVDTITHLHSHGAEWVTRGGRVMLLGAGLAAGHFEIPEHRIVLTGATTLDELQRRLPRAVAAGYTTGPDDAGYVYVRIRQDEEFGCWIFRFRNNRLDRIEQWWQLC